MPNDRDKDSHQTVADSGAVQQVQRDHLSELVTELELIEEQLTALQRRHDQGDWLPDDEAEIFQLEERQQDLTHLLALAAADLASSHANAEEVEQ